MYAGPGTDIALGLNRVAPFYYYPGFNKPNGTGECIVLLKAWEQLAHLLPWNLGRNGALVIGLMDNLVRPILVGSDTKMPNYVVLVSTVGGLATFGLNGLVIGPVIAAMFIAAWDIFSASREIAGDDGAIR